MNVTQTKEAADAPLLTILPDAGDKVVGGALHDGHDVLIQGVHVLHQPLVSRVVHLVGVVDDGEMGIGTEVRLLELGVGGVLGQQLVHKGLVRGLGEPALLIQQSKDAHGLQNTGGRHSQTGCHLTR